MRDRGCRGAGARICRRLGVAALLGIALWALPSATYAATVDRATSAVFAIGARGDRIGSGVLVAPGLLLTAQHVMSGPGQKYVLDGDRALDVTVVAVDDANDLALLRVDVAPSVKPIEWGDSTRLRRGQEVLVLGYPLGMTEVSLTKGVVSSPSQPLNGRTYIQTDAAINPGNSGGALVDAGGALVGINVAKFEGTAIGGIGFAVPAAEALRFVRRYARVDQSRGVPGAVPIGAGLAVVAAAAVALTLLVRARRGARAPAGPLHTSGPQRRRFRVDGPAASVTLDLRLPAVAGSGRNADIRLDEPEVAEYQVRFMPGPGSSVTALSLIENGMYCGDACVLEAVIAPGESVRVGRSMVTLLAEEGSGAIPA